MYQLGFAYEGLQKFGEATDKYDGALKYDPNYEAAKQGLARVKEKVSKS